MADPDFYREDHSRVQEVTAQLEQVQQELEQALARWLELEGE